MMHTIRIAVDEIGQGKCFIGEQDISKNVQRFEIHGKAGKLTHVTLHLIGKVEIEGTADVGMERMEADITSIADDTITRRQL